MAPSMPSQARYAEKPSAPVLLQTGDRMDQPTFHRLYLQTPQGFKAELIGGTVYVASPTSLRHGGPLRRMGQWIGAYTDATPGTDSYTDVTAILAAMCEPQPDISAIVMPDAGGQTWVTNGEFLTGAPELAIEISYSTAKFDLNQKKHDYEKYGVIEYIVVEVETETIHWFQRRGDKFVLAKPNADGLLTSKVFPGLWLDPVGVFHGTANALLAKVRLGLASAEHAKFVAKLAKKLKTPKPNRS